jgi:competence protein ComEA
MSTNETSPVLSPVRRIAAVVALCALVATGTATWLSSSTASAGPKPAPKATAVSTRAAADDAAGEPTTDPPAPKKSKSKQDVAGKLNLNTASSEQLQLLPGVGPSKADRIVAWRKKNGGFKRVADLRKVKGFGYKTLKKLEPFLDIKGDTTLATK